MALLIQSNVSRYLEFKCVTRILTKVDGEIVVVPCSRADVFATRGVSVVEKRMLMKIMNFVSEVEKEPEKLLGTVTFTQHTIIFYSHIFYR